MLRLERTGQCYVLRRRPDVAGALPKHFGRPYPPRMPQRDHSASILLYVGAEAPLDPGPRGASIVVDARLARRAWGTLDLARTLLEAQLGAETALVDLAAERVRDGLLRRFVGDDGSGQHAHRVATLLGRVQGRQGIPTTLVFAHLDDADVESLGEMPALLWDPRRAGAHIVLHLREEPRAGAPSTVWRAAVAVGARITQAAPAPTRPREPLAPWPPPGAHPSVTAAVRAVAELGEDATVDHLARALDRATGRVYELLQAAIDLGVPVRVVDDNRFLLPSSFADAIRRTTLPALRALWQARADEDAPDGDDADEREDVDSLGISEEGIAAVSAAQPENVRRSPDGGPDFGRTLNEALRAAEQGRHDDAVRSALDALALLPAAPSSNEDRVRRGGVHLAIASWMQGGAEAGGVGTLEDALHHARAAITHLDAGPVSQRAAARAVAAAISYEKGDLATLEWGIDQLTAAVSELHTAERPLDAARLLNDQAALILRAGDPVRAASLLRKSREIFARMEDRDPVARREIAECDHLLARLPFHVGARPGHERDAWERAMHHGEQARKGFESLHLSAEVARVTETLGRILLRLDRDQEAEAQLLRALRDQGALHDALGLARTTSALSELYTRAGRFEDALTLLAESARLNRARGSARGLEINRDAARLLLAAAGRERASWMASGLDAMGLLDGAAGPTTQE